MLCCAVVLFDAVLCDAGKDRQKRMNLKLEAAIPDALRTDLPFGGLQPYLPSERITLPNAIIAHMSDGIEGLSISAHRHTHSLSLLLSLSFSLSLFLSPHIVGRSMELFLNTRQ